MPSDQSKLIIEVCQSVFELRYKLRRMFQIKIKEAGIDASYEVLEILTLLNSRDRLNQQELADLLFKDKSSMTYLIDNMVKAGLVTRKEDEKDRRNKLILLSEKARCLIKQLSPIANHCYTALAEDIAYQDIKTGIQMLAKMNNSAEALIL